MWDEILRGTMKLAWAWIPFILVMIGEMIYEARHPEMTEK